MIASNSNIPKICHPRDHENIKAVIASGSKNAKQVVEHAGFGNLLDAIVDRHDIKKTKPDPQAEGLNARSPARPSFEETSKERLQEIPLAKERPPESPGNIVPRPQGHCFLRQRLQERWVQVQKRLPSLHSILRAVPAIQLCQVAEIEVSFLNLTFAGRDRKRR